MYRRQSRGGARGDGWFDRRFAIQQIACYGELSAQEARGLVATSVATQSPGSVIIPG